jgi:hypothetical protein
MSRAGKAKKAKKLQADPRIGPCVPLALRLAAVLGQFRLPVAAYCSFDSDGRQSKWKLGWRDGN